MGKYLGGCAVMLKMPENTCDVLENEALHWVGALKDCKYVNPDDYHLTLQFIGRDLEPEPVLSTITAAFKFASEQPHLPVTFMGAFSTLRTAKGSYLVARVEVTPELKKARADLLSNLSRLGVVPRDPFGFDPHVTLIEAPPKAALPDPPKSVERFAVVIRQLVVKYGSYRMIVEL